jgi:hypothetical protein
VRTASLGKIAIAAVHKNVIEIESLTCRGVIERGLIEEGSRKDWRHGVTVSKAQYQMYILDTRLAG